MALTQEETKEAVKEALKEWMDAKYAEAGKWGVTGILATSVVALAYFIFWVNGFGSVATK